MTMSMSQFAWLLYCCTNLAQCTLVLRKKKQQFFLMSERKKWKYITVN